MRYKLEKLGCYLLIIILLPYIVTVFLNGPTVVSSSTVEETMVNVRVTDDGESDVRSEDTSSEDLQKKEIITSMSIEDYGIGILACEIPGDYESEAIKAQAILVRTRLYKNLQDNGSDTVLTEKFWTRKQMEEAWGIGKYTANYNKFENAWHDTEGQVLLYEGELAYTPFFSLSNGSTRDGKEVLGKEYPYLKIKDCPLDIESVEQIQTVILEEMDAKTTDIEILSCDTAGYVLKVKIGKEEVNGEEFRNNYHLASSSFSIQEYDGKIRITTRGVGHGIGLSQYTANKMAENGNTYNEILEYFYEDCELKEAVDFVKKTETSDKTE